MSKNIVIVGASSGIGKEMVAYLVEQNDCHVYALSRNAAHLQNEFTSSKNLTCISFDLTKNVKEQIENSELKNVQIDYLINNAGLLVKKAFGKLSQSDFETSFQTNVIGPMQTVQTLEHNFNPMFTHIVNISTMGALQGSTKFPELIAYGASKAALCNFTEVFAEEFRSKNIRMNCLCLGAVNTQMLMDAFPGYTAEVQPNEMAEFILNFTFNFGSLMNGKIIPVSISTP